jgi:hypothetical protein
MVCLQAKQVTGVPHPARPQRPQRPQSVDSTDLFEAKARRSSKHEQRQADYAIMAGSTAQEAMR